MLVAYTDEGTRKLWGSLHDFAESMSHKIARAFSTQEGVFAVRRAQSARACTRLEHNANATGRTCTKGVDLPASELFNGLFTQT